MKWADSFRRLKVRTNADTPDDAANAVRLGAEGIGLCRTEHMFFAPDRIPKIRKMILSDTTEEREAALDELIPFQKGDFKGLYEAMEGRPVTIRFLDPPLHEFVPTEENEIEALAKDMNLPWRKSGALQCAEGIQPDDGPPRLPSVGHVSRDREDADQSGHRGRDRSEQGGEGLQRSSRRSWSRS
jgi:hypothetical protein